MRPTFYFSSPSARFPATGSYAITNDDFLRAEADLAALNNRQPGGLKLLIEMPEYDDDRISNMISLVMKSLKHLRWISGNQGTSRYAESVWRYRTRGEANMAEACRRVFERHPDVGTYDAALRTLELNLLACTTPMSVIMSFVRRVMNMAEWPILNTDVKLTSTHPFKWQTFDAISKLRQRGLPAREGSPEPAEIPTPAPVTDPGVRTLSPDDIEEEESEAFDD